MRPHAGRLVYPVALGLVAVLLTGCWDRIEVNDLAIVKGIALDRAGPNAIELTVALTVPANVTPPGSPGGPEAASPLANHAAQGSTVMEATSVLQEKLSRRLFWAHASVILIGEELARDGVAPVLEFFSRQRQPRLRMVVGVVPGRAADVLATMTPLEVETPEAIREMSTFRTGVFVTLREFLIMVAAEGEEPVAARVENVRTGAVQPGGPMDPTVSPLQEGPLQPAITGTAVFKGDRLVGWLDDHETRGLLWLRDELATATVTVPLGDSRWVSFEMIRAMTQLQPRFAGDRIVME
ncbi:MAG TPA: Ger(x)C family spore germination protein, partial [Bacillota bacterium]